MEDLGHGTRDVGSSLIDKASSMILEDMERPTVPRIQALILIVKYRAYTKRFASVFMLSALAVRFATGLRLNYEDTQLSFLARESCRRTMWSLYLIDSTLAAGYQDFTLSSSDMIHLEFPCCERNFELDLSPDQGGGGEDDNPLALVLRLAKIRHRVLQFSKKAVERRTLASDVVAGVQDRQRDLDLFLESLPPAYQLTNHNIMLHAYSSTTSVFVSLHATWHGVVCILNRLVLDGLVEALSSERIAELDPGFRRASERKCLESPKTVVDMLHMIQRVHVGTVPLDLDIAVGIYASLRVMVRSYQTAVQGGTEITHDILQYCQHGLHFLRSMFARTPAVDAIIQDTENLINEELCFLPTLTHPQSPSGRELSARRLRSHHVLSKHNAIRQIDMPNKEDSFLLSPSTTELGKAAQCGSPALNQAGSASTSLLQRDSQEGYRGPHDSHSVSNMCDDTNILDGWEFEGMAASSNQLLDLVLPDFGLDSSIFLPNQ